MEGEFDCMVWIKLFFPFVSEVMKRDEDVKSYVCDGGGVSSFWKDQGLIAETQYLIFFLIFFEGRLASGL